MKSFLNFLDSQKLFRYGVPSDSQFYYSKKSKELHWGKDLFVGMHNFESVYVPAYTDADLNEILPDKLYTDRANINANKYDLAMRKTRHSKWICEYENQIKTSPSFAQFQAHSEVEAKAKMILSLIQKKLIQL